MEAFLWLMISFFGTTSVNSQVLPQNTFLTPQLTPNIQLLPLLIPKLSINDWIVNNIGPLWAAFSQQVKVMEHVEESKVNLEKNIKETKKDFKLWVKNDWEEFRKAKWWLWKFFIDDLDNKKIKEIEKILWEQKQIIKDYLDNKKTLFDVYEISWMLEKYIKPKSLNEYRDYMNEKIDILKTQKFNIHKIKKEIKSSTIDIKKSILNNSEDKNIILAQLKGIINELPENKRESFVKEFISHINKNETKLTKDISEELLKLISTENNHWKEECAGWLTC